VVEAILVGSPADLDGRIMPGDVLLSVDGSGSGHYHVSTIGMSLHEISALVLGRRGSSVEFRVLRDAGAESETVTFTVRLRRGEADHVDLEMKRMRDANEALTQALLAVSTELEAREQRLAESVSVNADLAARLSLLADELQAHRLALGEKDSLVQSHSQSLQTAERAIEALEAQRDELKKELRESAREQQQLRQARTAADGAQRREHGLCADAELILGEMMALRKESLLLGQQMLQECKTAAEVPPGTDTAVQTDEVPPGTDAAVQTDPEPHEMAEETSKGDERERRALEQELVRSTEAVATHLLELELAVVHGETLQAALAGKDSEIAAFKELLATAEGEVERQKANHRATISELVHVEERLEKYKVTLQDAEVALEALVVEREDEKSKDKARDTELARLKNAADTAEAAAQEAQERQRLEQARFLSLLEGHREELAHDRTTIETLREEAKKHKEEMQKLEEL